jgi:hypothetical protein
MPTESSDGKYDDTDEESPDEYLAAETELIKLASEAIPCNLKLLFV